MPSQTSTEKYTASIRRQQLFDALREPEYRRAFADDIGTGIAFQIRALREDRGWTQQELAERMGKQQEAISQWENPDYGRFTLQTVKKLAAAFDVAPVVRFGSFRELVDWTIQLTPEQISPKPFDADLVDSQSAMFGAILPSSDASLSIKIAQPVYVSASPTVEVVASTIRGNENRYANAA